MGTWRDGGLSSSPNGEELRRISGQIARSVAIEKGSYPGGCIVQTP
jgi:hypothetical protein